MAGIIDQRHIGIGGVGDEIGDLLAEFVRIAVEHPAHIEAQLVEQVVHPPRIAPGIVEILQPVIVAFADHQRDPAQRFLRTGGQGESAVVANSKSSTIRDVRIALIRQSSPRLGRLSNHHLLGSPCLAPPEPEMNDRRAVLSQVFPRCDTSPILAKTCRAGIYSLPLLVSHWAMNFHPLAPARHAKPLNSFQFIRTLGRNPLAVVVARGL